MNIEITLITNCPICYNTEKERYNSALTDLFDELNEHYDNYKMWEWIFYNIQYITEYYNEFDNDRLREITKKYFDEIIKIL